MDEHKNNDIIIFSHVGPRVTAAAIKRSKLDVEPVIIFIIYDQ